MWVFNTRHEFGVETDPTQGEFFVNNEIDRSSALIRETVQNSLDAALEDAPKVEVRFTFHEGPLFLNPQVLQNYLNGLIPHLRACGLDLEEIDFGNPRFILVEDFGTHGLCGDPETKNPSDFYFFWHVVGRSGKGDSKGGRWGLGKTVFPNSSQISAFFGYTIRSDDPRPLLLGQTSLKTHDLGGEVFLPHAFYQSSPPRTFELPFDDPSRLNRFKADFHLARDRESGLSVVIPFPYREITENSLIEASIEHYFFPILAGSVGSAPSSSSTLAKHDGRTSPQSSQANRAPGSHGREKSPRQHRPFQPGTQTRNPMALSIRAQFRSEARILQLATLAEQLRVSTFEPWP